MKEYAINTTSDYPEDKTYVLSNGSKIRISGREYDVFQQYRSLPVLEKIELFDLSLQDIENYLKIQISKRKTEILSLINDTWYCRETGEIIDVDSVLEYSFGIKKSELEKKCKSRSKLPAELTESIIEFFLGEGTEFYREEQD